MHGFKKKIKMLKDTKGELMKVYETTTIDNKTRYLYDDKKEHCYLKLKHKVQQLSIKDHMQIH